MKIKHFIQILTAVIFLLFISCQQEEVTSESTEQLNENSFAKNWQEADLSKIFTGKEMNYPISVEQLKSILNHKNVYLVRFVPGVIEGKLQVKVVSIDAKGTVLDEELVLQNEDLRINDQLQELRTIVFNKETISDPMVSKHILQFDEAADFVGSWNQKSSLDLNEVTSYDGIRIRYFSMEPNAVQHMANTEVEYINLSWGLNKDNKLTTVFVPIVDTKIAAKTKNGNNRSAYDFTDPCPNTCRPD
ncbi:hypothetical protein [Aquimarina litoralis]|uniref:hypothetical protein n=1 Tax=Aquimarina litoralis TaxID=584605 RepID=UPI001C55DC14|nr:hypothetical protein [Aquimarina litoralis]MBW1297182.1 hypothetical protein [Aquimarina litoralis]